MKKKVLFVASLFLATATFAQDGLTSKKGEAYLPEAGDWALGFDANPFLNYAGNMFNGSLNNTLNLPWYSANNTIYGKMYKDETTAYRMQVRIGMGSTSLDGPVQDQGTDSSYVNTGKSSNGFTFIVGGGIEKRRGNTRLQGYYGAEALFGLIGGGNTSTDYGKDLSANDSQGATNAGSARTVKTSGGNGLTFGVNGFIGIEYFVLPKISIGAEYTWGLSFSSTGEVETDSEYFGLTAADAVAIAGGATISNHLVEETNVTSGSGSSFTLDTGNTGSANIKILFHF